MLEDCLKDLVGLSRSDCSCFEDDRPADYNTSLSGLYIADGLSLTLTQSAADCEQGGIWDILNTARERAINEFTMDYMHAVQSRYGHKYTNFYSSQNKSNLIGSSKVGSAVVSPVGNYAGLRITPNHIKGGFFTIEGVELALVNATVPVDVTVSLYSSLDLLTPIDSVVITVSQNKKFFAGNFQDPIKIDLSELDEDLDTIDYFLIYEIPQGAKVPRAKLYSGCNCGKASKKKYNEWLQFVDIDGVSDDTIEGFENPKYTNSHSMGLRIKATASCDYVSWICDLANDFDQLITMGDKDFKYASDLAQIINVRAKEIVLDTIMRSPNINRLTIFSRESLSDLRDEYRTKYAGYLEWFVQNLPMEKTSCLTCFNNKNVSKNTILI